MANILLLDDSEIAGRAMQGIAERSRNRCLVAASVDDAWRVLHEAALVDLVVVEIKLQNGEGKALISRIHGDPIFKNIPVLVYTKVQDHAMAAKIRPLGIQNYLIKPYVEEVVHQEVAKARSSPWREPLFEEEKSFCTQLGLTVAQLKTMRQELGSVLKGIALSMESGAKDVSEEMRQRLGALSDEAQAAGFWGLTELVTYLEAQVKEGQRLLTGELRLALGCLAELIQARINPNHVPPGLLTASEKAEAAEAADRAFWMDARVMEKGPVTTPDKVMAKVEALVSCPVIDTVGAQFIMATEVKSPTVQHVMDLVTRDPGLSAAVLIAANKLKREERDPVEHPGVAVTLLGSVALAGMSRTLPTIAERRMNAPPVSWPQFWLFQMGVASLAVYAAEQMELPLVREHAFTAGLLHDLGKLILLGTHPCGFYAMVNFARAHSISLHQAEHAYMGCTSRDMAVRFCQKHGLPPHYANVIRWVESPEAATEDVELVGVVSIARTLCMHHHVGYCGDLPKDQCPPVEVTAGWQVLKDRVYPTFNISAFDHGIHSHCERLKEELLGKVYRTAPEAGGGVAGAR